MNDFIRDSINDYRLPGLRMHISDGSITSRFVDSRNTLPRLDSFRYPIFRPTPWPHLHGNLASYCCTAT